MCGIAGFIDFSKVTDKDALVGMTDALVHRGPDASGYHYEDNNNYSLGLGHRRLSIIDISPLGNQPMQILDGKHWIVFNGEIYNYKEIRDELKSKGHSFSSSSDTEVVLYSFCQWGINAVNKFIGMFAFVLYDRDAQKLILFRDRAGVKPLYYYWENNLFLFGSELKALIHHPGFPKKVDPTSVFEYVQYGYIPAPSGIFKNTFKLEPGSFIEFDISLKTLNTHRYWNVYEYYNKPVQKIGEREAMEELEERLKKACDYRMIADVPVGVFLSGGYDSSLVTALLQSNRTEKIKTFTIGFNEASHNEADYAKQVAAHLGTEHHELYCTYAEAKEIIPQLPYYFDEPFSDSSAIPTILVSRFARQSVKVALSADAGDEIFGGYTKYLTASRHSQRIKKIPDFLRQTFSSLVKNIPDGLIRDLTPENKLKYAALIKRNAGALEILTYANMNAMPEIIQEYVQTRNGQLRKYFCTEEIRDNPDEITQMLAVDYVSHLPNDILTKVDRATMSVSLEGREPLLDQNIIEWVASLPSHFKIYKGGTKCLLKKITHKYIPRQLVERPKMGFSIPLENWGRTDLRYLLEHYFNDHKLAEHGYFNSLQIKKLLHNYYKGNNRSFAFIWNLLMFQMWYEKWVRNS